MAPAGATPPPPLSRRWRAATRAARIDAWLSVHGLSVLALGGWIGGCLSLWWFGAVREFTRGHAHDGGDLWQRWPITFARAGGFVLNLNAQLVLLVGCKAAWRAARAVPGVAAVVPVDALMPLFHTILGWVIAVSGTLHGINHLVAGLTPGSGILGWQAGWGQWTHAAASGVATLVVMWVLIATTVPRLRRRAYEAFWWGHQAAAAAFVALLLLHGILDFRLYTYKWLAPVVAVYAADRGWRVWGTTAVDVEVAAGGGAASPPSAAATGATPAGGCEEGGPPASHGGRIAAVTPTLLRLSLPRPWAYRPGQYAELCIPAVARAQWHPLTMASAPHEREVVFYASIVPGGWTAAVAAAVTGATAAAAEKGATEGGGPPTTLRVRLRGPYGAPCVAAAHFDTLLLVGAGAGVTPIVSLAKAVAWERGTAAGATAGASEVGGGEVRTVTDGWPSPPPLVASPHRGDGGGDGGGGAPPPLPWDGGDPQTCAICPSDASGRAAQTAAAVEGALLSATALWLTAVAVLARAALVGIATPLSAVSMTASRSLSPFNSAGLVAADGALAAVVAAVAVALAAARGVRRRATAADAVGVAVAVAGVALPVAAAAAAGGGAPLPGPGPVGILHLAVALPAAAVGVVVQAAGAWRGRLLLAPHARGRLSRRRGGVTVVTAVAGGDGWVVDALGGAPGPVGVHHRYVTRPHLGGAPGGGRKCGGGGNRGDKDEGDQRGGGGHGSMEKDLEAGPPPAGGGPIPCLQDGERPSSTFALPAASAAAAAATAAGAVGGRPPLGALLAATAATTPSHSTVGVAFCGPRRMEVDLRTAAAAATAASRRGDGPRGGCPPCGRDIRFLVRAERF